MAPHSVRCPPRGRAVGLGAARRRRHLKALEGITVVALEHAIAAPFCTRQLADLGARAILARLLARADVLVQNLAPGAAARMGLAHEALAEAHPTLIVCDISGYGDDPARPGPYRDKKAYDLLIQSESGFLSVTGTADEPVKAGCSIADIAAGMVAYSGILAALIERGRTGKGK